MRFLVAGCGSIGMRHLRNLIRLGQRDLLACDPVPDRRRRAKEEFGAGVFDSLDEALGAAPDVVIVAAPTHLHVTLALEAAEAGCHLFIEKPLSHTEEGLSELIGSVRRKELISLVACNMRFHHGPRTIKSLVEKGVTGRPVTAILDAGQYLPDWHPDLDYRKRYSARRDMGGGVVLDGIHELDYARWILGEITEVFCAGGQLSSLEIDVEDCVNILAAFESGCSAAIHLDYIQRSYARSCKIIGEEGTIIWELGEGVRSYSATRESWEGHPQPDGYTLNDMYIGELRHFLACLSGRERSMLDVEEGARVTRIAFAVKRSLREGKKVAI